MIHQKHPWNVDCTHLDIWEMHPWKCNLLKYLVSSAKEMRTDMCSQYAFEVIRKTFLISSYSDKLTSQTMERKHESK